MPYFDEPPWGLGGRRLVFTNHARRRMIERGISEEDVNRALSEPVQILYDRGNDVYLVLGSNNVAVVVADRVTFVEIVTVLRRKEYEALTGRLGRKRYRWVM
jgi:hypothetical protein